MSWISHCRSGLTVVLWQDGTKTTLMSWNKYYVPELAKKKKSFLTRLTYVSHCAIQKKKENGINRTFSIEMDVTQMLMCERTSLRPQKKKKKKLNWWHTVLSRSSSNMQNPIHFVPVLTRAGFTGWCTLCVQKLCIWQRQERGLISWNTCCRMKAMI